MKNMKKISLSITALIGLYAFLRNNVGMLPDQIILNPNPDIFYKMFIPILMFGSAILSILKPQKVNCFYLSMLSMVVDAVNRFAIFINYYYLYFTYSPIPEPVHSPGSVTVVNNLMPSHIMLFLEILTFIYIWKYILKHKS